MKIGFIGLGVMGMPIAINLARAGNELVAWNRSAKDCAALLSLGARLAASPEDVFAGAGIVVMMLANEAAVDAVLQRASPAFAAMVKGKTLVYMGTVSPGFSGRLEADVIAAGGRYVEAPVSGSRIPAEQGLLVGMLAGDPEAVAAVRAVVGATCKETFSCGAVPGALTMKLAVNLFLITMVSGLAEAANFAQHQGLDMSVFRAIIESGPMHSRVAGMKLPMFVEAEFPVQAAINDVLMNSQLVANAAHEAGIAAPLIDCCVALFSETRALGHGGKDMAAVVLALAARSAGRAAK